MFVHITTHSAYSLQEGQLTPAELVQAASADGMRAIGLTDHKLLTGTIEFVTACREAGIQPIIGLEIDMAAGPLQLLAANLDGWSNLCRLSSALALRDKPEEPCPLDTLAEYSAGLIASSNNPQPLLDIFDDRLYVSLHDPDRAATTDKYTNCNPLSNTNMDADNYTNSYNDTNKPKYRSCHCSMAAGEVWCPVNKRL